MHLLEGFLHVFLAVAAHHSPDENLCVSLQGSGRILRDAFERVTGAFHGSLQGGFGHGSRELQDDLSLFVVCRGFPDTIDFFEGLFHMSLAVTAHHAFHFKFFSHDFFC